MTVTQAPGNSPASYVVPPALRGYGFVPRTPGTRKPARVVPSAFTARGLPVPDERREWNVYQLTERQGYPWSPALDSRIGRCGAELLGHGELIVIDCDSERLDDGSPGIDGFRWLIDRVTEAGELLDVRACLSVRTPGNRERGHGPGWHLWFVAGPPLRLGPLQRCRLVEIKARGTCPGSPGYDVISAPAELPRLPQWAAELAGPPPEPRHGAAGGPVRPRLEGILETVLGARQGERNRLLHWAACRVGEIVSAGQLDSATAQRILADAAAEIGLPSGEAAATIGSGLRIAS